MRTLREQKKISNYEKAFPGREIVFVDAMPLNWQGGGIHCSTQQEPKRRGVK
ncbi:agmatine deiminase family protein [Mongoliitalea daihaiensis]|uniref:agmatine deiminase family protein n=1 Tax=Mongoliitalea daihaiensis TaxID=2782006 RepID=UPI00374D92FB